jgi:serine/threonine-protein kinase PpkA
MIGTGQHRETKQNMWKSLVSMLALLATAALAELPPIQCDGKTVCRELGTGLPLMLLPRSFSNVFTNQALDAVAVENTPEFQPLFVFQRTEADPPLYQVGRSEQGPPLGWMRGDDVLEWRQALIAAFTHPGSGEEARQRVLMFKYREVLEALLEVDDRALRFVKLYDRIDARDIPGDVLSKEPESFVDINETFYLLPVVDYALTDLDGDELRLLRLASALPGERAARDDQDVLGNPRYREQSGTARPDPGQIKELGMDLVFVMDMTKSMQPYIDRTKQAIAGIVRQVAEGESARRIRFGLVGFRDDVSMVPALEFIRHNFTPELLETGAFLKVLSEDAKAATVSSPGYSEDLFAGVEQGLDSAWRENSLHFMVLVGDASGHPPGHAQSSTGLDANMLGAIAQDQGTHILAIQLVNPKHPEDQARAEQQFGKLSSIRGADESALVQVRTDAEADYQVAVEKIALRILDTLFQLEIHGSKALDVKADYLQDQAADFIDDSVGGQADQAMGKVIRSAMVEYLGQDARPPRDLLVWAADRDPTNPSIRTLEVRVLLSREQLSDLGQALERILDGLDRSQMSSLDFFDALQGLSAQSMKQPDAIARVDSLRQAGLVPRFIEALPYHSEITSLDRDSYASMTAAQRADLMQRLTAKLNQYRKINETVDGWAELPSGSGRKLYPLQLDYLP